MLLSIVGHRWLDGEVINAYLSLLTRMYNANLASDSAPRVELMDSYFFEILNRNYHHINFIKNCNAWKNMTELISNFRANKIQCFVFPVLVHNHWILNVFKQNGHWIILDPLGAQNKRNISTTRKMLQRWVVQTFPEKRWNLWNALEKPIQTDSHNCGVFVCMFSEHILFHTSSPLDILDFINPGKQIAITPQNFRFLLLARLLLGKKSDLLELPPTNSKSVQKETVNKATSTTTKTKSKTKTESGSFLIPGTDICISTALICLDTTLEKRALDLAL
eukprot:TRINITY_DN1858_c0_g1_i2.p1 TRINITY_DN1858_c0_g1~~TRINITY_DN1858_c0_g1_i2.p1  ORF type:complete len:277 (+),score=37.06 TRINITY_DN1858_c0_g1_i2:405-1235(+)